MFDGFAVADLVISVNELGLVAGEAARNDGIGDGDLTHRIVAVGDALGIIGELDLGLAAAGVVGIFHHRVEPRSSK